jgi:thiol peroxidase
MSISERGDFYKIGETFMTILGDDVKVGQAAPGFTSTAQDWSRVNPLDESKGKVAILCAAPSLETSVCDRETRRFNEEAANLSPDIRIYVITTDLPVTLKRWCGAAGVERVQVVSDSLETEFALKYGVLIRERRYMRRAVFIVGRDGVLTYVAYMEKLGDEPDYAEVLEAARAALAPKP